MKIRHLFFVFFAALVAGCSKSAPSNSTTAASPTAATTTKTFPLGAPGSLAVTFPATWKEEDTRVVERETDKTATFDGLKFTPTNSERCAFLIELVPANTNNGGKLDLKSMLRAQIPPELSNSPPEIQTVTGMEAEGYYFRLTDPRTNLPAGEFRYGTEGFAKLGPIVLVFKMVNDDPASEPEGLEVIRTAQITKP